MWYVITSAVTIVKSHEKKSQNYFPMTEMSLNFQKMDTILCLTVLNRKKKMMEFDEDYLGSTSNKILLRQC